ncbi:MAG: hypothetical protein AB8B83_01700 [Bdellovibrionales bacterium]
MFKYISMITIVVFVSAAANAQIYLRKDNQPSKPGITATKPSPQTNQAPSQRPAPKEVEPSRAALENARAIANVCLNGKWQSQPCLSAVSQSNLVMASNYAAALSENKMEQNAEAIKQQCAASTAATRDSFPANAMRSAYVECVNAIVQQSQETGLVPDQSQFQLLVSAVQCLDLAPTCNEIERGLSAYRY